jgi:LysR family transcriptional activator of nhaA
MLLYYRSVREWLNYHHLHYFWTVVRLGGLAPAAEELRLAPSTISAQIRRLEESLSERLFRKSGRRLALTDMGRLVFGYADEIFSTGREMLKAVQGLPTGRPMRLVVGIADVVPKLVAQRLIEPALRLTEPVQVVCREASPEQLVDGLSRHLFDLLITDAPLGAEVKVRAHSHLLGDSGVTFVAEAALARQARGRFPASLDRQPMLLPTENMAIRGGLDQWFEANGVRPRVVGEFEDGELLREFGTAGCGVFVVPTMVEQPLVRQYRLKALGRSEAVRARVYGISPERRVEHPAAAVVFEAARRQLRAGSQAERSRRAGR